MAQTQAGLDGEINSFLPSGSDITAATLRQVLHDMNAGIFQSGVTALGAPTVFAGLVAVPGSATSAMRSDAAPAISQSIVPTWTGQHIFGNLTPSVSSITGAVTVAGGVGIAGMLNVGTTVNSSGSIYVNNAPVQAAQRVTGTVSGTVSTTDIAFTLPSGATLLGVTTYTTVAFLASGSVSLTAGSAVGDNIYVTATATIKSLGVLAVSTFGTTTAGVSGLASMPSNSPNFFVRLTQTGTPSVVGSVIIVVDYLVP